MKSDVVKVKNTGEGIDDALSAASASAVYRGLGKKESLHLRLLAEEMLGMFRQITGETEAEFYVESEGTRFRLCLAARPIVTGNMRRELLKASSSGKNAAARGFMGKLRDIFDQALAAEDMDGMSNYFAQGLTMSGGMYLTGPMNYVSSGGMMTWSMKSYKTAVEGESAQSPAAKEEWDELEKSIVANIADEVEISIVGDKVKMTVYKNF